MKNAFLLLITCTFLFLKCTSETENHLIPLINSDGIWVEKIDSIVDENINPYNVENEIYQVNREFIFDYIYFDSLGNPHKLSKEGYGLTPLDSITPLTIVKVSFWVESKLNMLGLSNDYHQSGIQYEHYLPNENTYYPKEGSGLIENRKNVWIHPFRAPYYFRMLNICPYPFVQKPLQIGRQWKWELGIGGSRYTGKEWAEWEGTALFSHSYEVIEKVNISTKLGDFDCWKIIAKGSSRIGKTGLIFYFNEEFGFVKLVYDNINKSRIEFELMEIRMRQDS